MVRSIFYFLCCFSLIAIELGAVNLVSFKSSECKENTIAYASNYSTVWLNDSVMQIRAKASLNCSGLSNPKVTVNGPLLNLIISDFEINGDMSTCLCVYEMEWVIGDVSKSEDFICLLNGFLFSSYNKSLLKLKLKSYKADEKSLQLLNAIDKKGLKQGAFFLYSDIKQNYEWYCDGVLISQVLLVKDPITKLWRKQEVVKK